MKNKLKNTKNKIKSVGVASLGDPLPKRNTQRGITLVALIITVIILLILAIVSIQLIMNGGIIGKVERGMQSYTEAEIKEKIGTAYQEYQMSQYSNPITFEEALVHSGLSGATVSEDGLTVSYKGKDYPLTENGAVGDAKTVVKVLAGETAPLDSNAEYTSNGKKAIVPAGYTVSNIEGETSIDTGLVVRDSSGNEWVWIPVSSSDLAAMYTEDTTGWTMSGTSAENAVVTKYKTTGTESRVNPGDTSSFREPDILSNTSCDNKEANWKAAGFTSYKNMAEGLSDDYKKMITSVKKYGGFYIGRYELGKSGTTAQVKAGLVYSNSNWYELYAKCKSLDSTGVETRMIWGCQWDQVLKFISTAKDANGDPISLNDSRKYGNYKDSQAPANTNSGSSNFNNTTGRNSAWKTNNIYDLAGNCWEETQEAHGNNHRVNRSGSCLGASGKDEVPVTYHNWGNPTDTHGTISTRPVLYIK